jgi:hypothetical protein
VLRYSFTNLSSYTILLFYLTFFFHDPRKHNHVYKSELLLSSEFSVLQFTNLHMISKNTKYNIKNKTKHPN